MTTWRAKATSTSAIAIASFLALGLATAAHAQEGASAPPRDTGAAQADSDRNKEIIVTGTRRHDLTAAQSPTPIDIISSDDLLNQGSSDVTEILRKQVPSLHVHLLPTKYVTVFTRSYAIPG